MSSSPLRGEVAPDRPHRPYGLGVASRGSRCGTACHASRAVPPHPGVAPLRAVSPRLRSTRAAFVSAFAAYRQAIQRNLAWLIRLLGAVCPHIAHSIEEFRGSTFTSTPPFVEHL